MAQSEAEVLSLDALRHHTLTFSFTIYCLMFAQVALKPFEESFGVDWVGGDDHTCFR